MTLKEKLLENKKRVLLIGIAAAAVLLVAVVTGILVITLSKENSEKPPQVHKTTAPTETVYAPPEETTLSPQDFQYDGAYLTCIAAPSMLGVDVSSHRGQIDWQAVKDAGITFAMIRVGGRGYGAKGVLYTDEYAQENYAGAKAVGIQVGAYFFSQATSVEEAREEARMALEQVRDWEMDFPLVYDWERMEEEGSRTLHVEPRVVTDCMKAFCQEVKNAGRDTMIYFNPDHAESMFFIEEVTEHGFWLAFYTSWMNYPYKIDMWQYTNTGSVPGIQGDVDINLYFPEA